MNEEKIMILKMLEEGKITSEEAAKLLDALKDESQTERRTNKADQKWAKDIEEKVDRLGKNMDSWTKDFGKKVEVLSKDLEPKLQKVAQNVLDKTAILADKVSKTLSDPELAYKFGIKPRKEMELEISVDETNNNQLSLNGKNGTVNIRGYNGDKLITKVNYIAKIENPNIELMNNDCCYALNYDEADFESVGIEAFVPETFFEKMKIDTTNGKIYIDTIKTKAIKSFTTNGRIDLRNIEADTVEAETSNGKVYIDQIEANLLQLETSNGIIDTKQVNVERLELITSNASIAYDISEVQLTEEKSYDWKIETANAPIKIRTPKEQVAAYDLKANTSLNGIQLNLENLEYTQNEKNYVEAKTKNYEETPIKVKFNLETSNAPIIINE